MRIDRAEAAGLGLSIAGHAAIVTILVLGTFAATTPPLVVPPAIEVDIVADDVAVTSKTPEPAQTAPAPRVSPTPTPELEVAPPPVPEPAPVVRPAPTARPAAKIAPQSRPAPKAVAAPRPTPPVDERPRRRPGLDPAIVAGLRTSPGALVTRPSTTPGSAPKVAVGPAQVASLGAAILRQVQPCANRIVSPGPGAERIVTRINLQLNRDGSFAAPPRVIGQVTDADNARYGPRVGEVARAAFVQCAPFELPAELYDGWRNIILRYKLPE